MSAQKLAVWLAAQARMRQGYSVVSAVEQCRQAGIAVTVVRHHLGAATSPNYGRSEDVTAEYLPQTQPAQTRG